MFAIGVNLDNIPLTSSLKYFRLVKIKSKFAQTVGNDAIMRGKRF